MCTVCGCSAGETRIESHDHSKSLQHKHQPSHGHDFHTDIHDYGQGLAHVHAPGMSQARMVQIEEDILGKNNHYAAANRHFFNNNGILAINLVSAPGSGKTTLLTKTIALLKQQLPIAVIEGDQQTANDAARIKATGVKALQVNTGKGCHLDAHMIGHAVENLQPEQASVLFIENVGNLVCPAAFDLGEAHKVVILSTTEGEDKPIKYPDMFHAADAMILNKIDLLPHLDFDVAQCIEFAQQVNPRIKVLQLSATSGAGMTDWRQWLQAVRNLAMLDYVQKTSDS